jgi:hypothetical protein
MLFDIQKNYKRGPRNPPAQAYNLGCKALHSMEGLYLGVILPAGGPVKFIMALKLEGPSGQMAGASRATELSLRGARCQVEGLQVVQS